MNPLQPYGLCRRASLIAVSGLLISFTSLSQAEFADVATSKVAAVFDQGIGLQGTVDLGKCVMRVDPSGTTTENKIPAKTLSTQQEGYIKDVGISFDNSRLVRLSFEERISPTFLVRSEDLRITPEVQPGWVIREFRFSLGMYMVAKVQLSANESWTWDCSDVAINITNLLPQPQDSSPSAADSSKKPPEEL